MWRILHFPTNYEEFIINPPSSNKSISEKGAPNNSEWVYFNLD